MILEKILKNHQCFSAILPAEIDTDNPCIFDLQSPQSAFYGITDTEELITITQALLEATATNFGIGQYAESRFIYEHLPQFEQRNVHLGIDLTVPIGTRIMTPLAGRVVSVHNNSQMGDYGPTIILQHQLSDRLFYTLYGHLSEISLSPLVVGQQLDSGAAFACVGNQYENGGWPPHLHFQVIADLQGHVENYPGVCSEQQSAEYLKNCPDPNLMLGFIKS